MTAMPHKKLEEALFLVDWNSNVAEFLTDASSATLAECNLRLAIWSKQFEIVDGGNPALPFIREMQVAGHHVVALTGLSLYKPAAAAMRIMLETALYYTYFRTHPSELRTLAHDPKYFIEKSDLIDYHNRHTPDFKTLQGRLGLVDKLRKWYNFTSSIVHGQIPGGWVEHKSLAETRHVPKTLSVVVEAFSEGVDIVHSLFLCTVGRELWRDFSSTAKKILLAGLSGEVKTALGLDRA